MPQVKTRPRPGIRKRVPARRADSPAAETSTARELIGKMLDYEAAAQERGIDFCAGRFRMLTASERRLLRAELVADYVRLCSAATGRTAAYHREALNTFCRKVCDMQVPSHELMGTYLAAVDVVSTKGIAWLRDAVQGGILQVLQNCVRLMRQKTQSVPDKLAA